MFKTLFLSAFLISPLEMFETDADYGFERCVSDHCTCRVSLDRMNPSPVTFKVSNLTSVYFEEDGHTITSESKEKVKEFLASNPGRYITIVGYTDGCGKTSYNSGLAMLRAKSIKREVLRNRSSAVLAIKTVAEVSRHHDPSSRRVDIIVSSTRQGFPYLPKVKADVYLIDASGSMSSKYDRWLEVVSLSRPRLSKVYVSYAPYCYNGQDAISINPNGATEIWYSYWKTLKRMSPGQTLVIISDFQSKIPLTAREADILRNIVESKSIRVIAISP